MPRSCARARIVAVVVLAGAPCTPDARDGRGRPPPEECAGVAVPSALTIAVSGVPAAAWVRLTVSDRDRSAARGRLGAIAPPYTCTGAACQVGGRVFAVALADTLLMSRRTAQGMTRQVVVPRYHDESQLGPACGASNRAATVTLVYPSRR